MANGEWRGAARDGRASGKAVGPLARSGARTGRGRVGAFTLVEVLAALLFMAIVIPVAVEGIQIASRAGMVAHRKAVAARVAERVLNELLITGQWQSSLPNGRAREGKEEYDWSSTIEPWESGLLQQLTVRVTYFVQGREYNVDLATLADSSAALSTTNATTTSSGASGGTAP